MEALEQKHKNFIEGLQSSGDKKLIESLNELKKLSLARRIDIFKFHGTIKFPSVEIEEKFVDMIYDFMNEDLKLSKKDQRIWNMIVHQFRNKNSRLIIKLIPYYTEIALKDKTNLVNLLKNLDYLFIYFYNDKEKRDANKPILSLLLETYVEVIRKSNDFNDLMLVVSKLTDEKMKIFQLVAQISSILTNKFHKAIAMAVCEVAEKLNGFPKLNDEHYMKITKLFAEFFSQHLNIETSIECCRLVMNVFNLDEFKYYEDFFDWIECRNGKDAPEMVIKTLNGNWKYKDDLAVTISEILFRIHYSNWFDLLRTGGEFDGMLKVFRASTKIFKALTIEKNFCSHCTNIKRHSMWQLGVVIIQMARVVYKRNRTIITPKILSEIIRIFEYTFTVIDSLVCSTKPSLFGAIIYAAYSMLLKIANDPELGASGNVLQLFESLIRHRQKYGILNVQLDDILRVILFIQPTDYKNPRHLEWVLFLLVTILQKKDKVDRKYIISILYDIIKRYYTNETELMTPFTQILNRLNPSMFFEISLPKIDHLEILTLLIEIVETNFTATETSNVRILICDEILKFIDTDPVRVAHAILLCKNTEYKYLPQIERLLTSVTQTKINQSFESSVDLIIAQLHHKIFAMVFKDTLSKRQTAIFDFFTISDPEKYESIDVITHEAMIVKHLKAALEIFEKCLYKTIDIESPQKICTTLSLMCQQFTIRNMYEDTIIANSILYIWSTRYSITSGRLQAVAYFMENPENHFNVFVSKFTPHLHFKNLDEFVAQNVDCFTSDTTIKDQSNVHEKITCKIAYARHLYERKKFAQFNCEMKKLASEPETTINNFEEGGATHITFKFYQLIVYYKMQNNGLMLNVDDIDLPIVNLILNYMKLVKNVKYYGYSSIVPTATIIMQCNNMFYDYLFKKKLVKDLDSVLQPSLLMCYRLNLPHRNVELIKETIRLGVATEKFQKIDLLICCLNRCLDIDYVRVDSLQNNESTKKLADHFQMNNYNSDILGNDIMVRRDHQPTHLDQMQQIMSPPIVESNHEIYLRLDVDLQTHLSLIDVTITIGQHFLHTNDLMKARKIFNQVTKEIKKLNQRYLSKDDKFNNILMERIMVIEMSLSEQLATLEILSPEKKDYNLMRSHLEHAENLLKKIPNFQNRFSYRQQILNKLKSVEFLANENRSKNELETNRPSRKITKKIINDIKTKDPKVVKMKCEKRGKTPKKLDLASPEPEQLITRRGRRRSPRF